MNGDRRASECRRHESRPWHQTLGQLRSIARARASGAMVVKIGTSAGTTSRSARCRARSSVAGSDDHHAIDTQTIGRLPHDEIDARATSPAAAARPGRRFVREVDENKCAIHGCTPLRSISTSVPRGEIPPRCASSGNIAPFEKWGQVEAMLVRHCFAWMRSRSGVGSHHAATATTGGTAGLATAKRKRLA